MPADASAAATDRPEPSGPTDVVGREAGATVPPPRSAPADESTPAASPAGGSTPAIPPSAGPAAFPSADTPAPGRGAAEASPTGTGAVDAGEVPVPDATGQELTERERLILAFEQRWWKHAGAKEQAIRDTFGLSATRYYQLLNGLLDHPGALAAEPVLIGRLRRLRSSRARSRRR